MLASVSINEIKDLLIISIAAITPILHAIKAALEAYSSFLKTRAEIKAQTEKNKREANKPVEPAKPRRNKLKVSDIFFLIWQAGIIVFLLFFVELRGWTIFLVLISWTTLVVFFVMKVADRLLKLIDDAYKSDKEMTALMWDHVRATDRIVGIMEKDRGIKNGRPNETNP